ncbi:MAG: hypothetical protein NTU80_01150 [Verrucomicrobia bacterium]|nr:hypothetical protein [Verrucomicrobiota bacterium]
MNKLYLIAPILLTLAFSGLYTLHTKEAGAKAEKVRIEAARVVAETEAKKQAAEKQAKEDSDRRTAERIAEEKRKEEEKRTKWETAGKAIADDTTAFLAQAVKNEAEIKALEAKLASLRADKDKATQAAFDFEIEIEKARVAKRTAELEIQRLVEMVARKGGTTLGSVTATP